MSRLKSIGVSLEGCTYNEYQKIHNRLSELADGVFETATYELFMENDWLFIDEDGDVNHSHYHGDDGTVVKEYTVEEFWKEFGRQDSVELGPEDLEFGQVIHVRGRPYAFIKQDHVYLWATARCGTLTPICPTQVDEFQIDSVDQRKQAFLDLWRSQGLGYSNDGWRDEVSRWNWCVENLFDFIEQHRESIVEIFSEESDHE